MQRAARAILLAVAMFACGLAAHAADPWIAGMQDVPLGARLDRFDYQSIDPATGRLFVAMMSEAKLLVFDTRTNAAVATLDGFPKVTGVLAVPSLRKVFVSVPGAGIGPSLSVALGMVGLSQGGGEVAILDADTLREIGRVPGGVFPDGLAFAPAEKKVFVTDEFGSALTVIDADTNRTVARIDLGGQVGNVQFDRATGRIYAPIQSRDELVAVDPATDAVVARYNLHGGRHPHGLAIAPNAAIGYVACDEDDRLLTVDLRSGAVLLALPLPRDPDVLAIDPALGRLYVASESGSVAAFDLRAPGKPIALGEIAVADGAHTVAVDAGTHRLFLPLRDVGGQAVMRIVNVR